MSFLKTFRFRTRRVDQIFGAVDGQHGKQSLLGAAALIRFATLFFFLSPCLFSTMRRGEKTSQGDVALGCRRHPDRRILKSVRHPLPSPSMPLAHPAAHTMDLHCGKIQFSIPNFVINASFRNFYFFLHDAR